MSDTPLTDAADDVTMRFSARHERLKELCKTLEAKLAENTGFKAIGYVHKALGCTSTVYENLPDGGRTLYIAIDKATEASDE